MNVSLRWLARHVDLSGISPQEIADRLTLHTAEVEGLEPFAPWLSDVVVGHVVERTKHPDADKLNVCKVDLGAAGDGELAQIVCGAPNVDAGQKVAVGRVGTVLPGDLKLKKAKIRGVESRGMICSERELDLGDDHDGIWVLPQDAGVGLPVAEALDVVDHVIEIDNKSLTHRPDLWGHRGLAGELACLFGRELRPLDLSLPETGAGDPYPARVESEGCPRYLGLAIDGVQNGKSPLWMRMLLLAAGQRPLDLLVDLSNFVMLDLAQPNHLFDRKRLSPEGIVVRNARAGETMETLDGVERTFTSDDMLIVSGDAPVAIAGVMGGEASKVEGDTSELLLEVASFHPTLVRRTAARLGLRTDASARFEKSLDPTLPVKAAGHLVRLLQELQPNVSLPRPLGDAGSWEDPAKTVHLRPARARAILGKPISDEEMQATLTGLGFGVTAGGDRWSVAVPSARATKDVGIEEDLIEEIGRVHGYDNIPEDALLAVVEPVPRDERRRMVRRLQDRLAGPAGFHEAMTYTFQSDGLLGDLGLDGEAHLSVQNPQVEDAARIRRSVLPSLIGLLPQNRRRDDDVRLFEIGKGYRIDEPNERGEPRELHQCAIAWARPRPGKGARFDAGVLPQLQAVVEDLVRDVDRGTVLVRRGVPEDAPSWAHPGKFVTLHLEGYDGTIGLLAELEPGRARTLGLSGELDGDVGLVELSLDALLEAPVVPKRYAALPRYPAVKVDVALALSDDVSQAEVAAVLEKAGKGLVAGLELFDLYRAESLAAGKKSLAYHVTLQSNARTLSDKDEAKFLDRVERQIQELGGELRRE